MIPPLHPCESKLHYMYLRIGSSLMTTDTEVEEALLRVKKELGSATNDAPAPTLTPAAVSPSLIFTSRWDLFVLPDPRYLFPGLRM